MMKQVQKGRVYERRRGLKWGGVASTLCRKNIRWGYTPVLIEKNIQNSKFFSRDIQCNNLTCNFNDLENNCLILKIY